MLTKWNTVHSTLQEDAVKAEGSPGETKQAAMEA